MLPVQGLNSLDLPLSRLTLLRKLLAPGGLAKPPSTLYGALLGTDSPKLEKLWKTWHSDIPSLDREGWEDCLEYGPKLVISSKDKLIQVKFLHRIYYTPQRLHRIYLDRDPECPRCKAHTGTFFHIFWDCPIISAYWTKVFGEINSRLQLSLPMIPELALLGVHDDEQRSRHSKLLISYLLLLC